MKKINISKIELVVEIAVAIVFLLIFLSINFSIHRVAIKEIDRLNDKVAILEDSINTLNNSLDRAIFEKPEFMYKAPKEGLMEALLYYGVEHPEIVYAQAILETGYFKSELCLNGKNLFGLYDSIHKHYHYFDHWAQSVEGYKNWVQNKLKPGEDYYEFLDRIGYAEDPRYVTKVKYLVEHNDKR